MTLVSATATIYSSNSFCTVQYLNAGTLSTYTFLKAMSTIFLNYANAGVMCFSKVCRNMNHVCM